MTSRSVDSPHINTARPSSTIAPEQIEALARAASAAAARFSVIVVTFNSADHLADCIDSVPAEAELIIVDNGSTDGGPDLASRIRPSARVHPCRQNLGFGAGCNIGARIAGRELLLFLNPDASLTDGALEQLASVATAQPRAIVGPELQDAAGLRRFVCRRMSRPIYELRDLLPFLARLLERNTRDLPRRCVFVCDFLLKYVEHQILALLGRGIDAALLCRDHAGEFGGDASERATTLERIAAAGADIIEIRGRISDVSSMPEVGYTTAAAGVGWRVASTSTARPLKLFVAATSAEALYALGLLLLNRRSLFDMLGTTGRAFRASVARA